MVCFDFVSQFEGKVTGPEHRSVETESSTVPRGREFTDVTSVLANLGVRDPPPERGASSIILYII